jgi:hypothetical protein
MTREQAIARLRRLYGQKAYWRVSDRISSPERRLAALEAHRARKAAIDALDLEIKERLAALDWYQKLITHKRQLREIDERERWGSSAYKFAVGRNIGYANEITGEGDTWEEAIEKAEAKK